MAFEGTGGIQPSASGFVQGLLPDFIYVVLMASQIRTEVRYNSLLHRGSECMHSWSALRTLSFFRSGEHRKPHILRSEAMCNFVSYARVFQAPNEKPVDF